MIVWIGRGGNRIMEKERLEGLDILRITSALVTFLFHSHIHRNCQYGIFNDFINMGAIFMTAFFMLSGFSLFISNNTTNIIDLHNMKKFYIKRIISIVPMYYFIAIIYVLFLRTESLLDNIVIAPIEMLGLQTVFTSLFEVVHNGGTWFISCIIICYLFYPFIQEVMKQLTYKNKIFILLMCIGILLYSPIITHWFHTANIYSNPFFRGLEFTIGVLLASIKDEVKESKILYTWGGFLELGILILGVTIAAKLNIKIGDYMLYSWIGLPIFILMILTLSKIEKVKINDRIIRYLSSISYCYFLAQYFTWETLDVVLIIIGKDNNVIRIIASFFIVLIYAILLHEFIEKPVTKFLKRKLLKDV